MSGVDFEPLSSACVGYFRLIPHVAQLIGDGDDPVKAEDVRVKYVHAHPIVYHAWYSCSSMTEIAALLHALSGASLEKGQGEDKLTIGTMPVAVNSIRYFHTSDPSTIISDDGHTSIIAPQRDAMLNCATVSAHYQTQLATPQIFTSGLTPLPCFATPMGHIHYWATISGSALSEDKESMHVKILGQEQTFESRPRTTSWVAWCHTCQTWQLSHVYISHMINKNPDSEVPEVWQSGILPHHLLKFLDDDSVYQFDYAAAHKAYEESYEEVMRITERVRNHVFYELLDNEGPELLGNLIPDWHETISKLHDLIEKTLDAGIHIEDDTDDSEMPFEIFYNSGIVEEVRP